MKTPKEKAHDLVVGFWYLVPDNAYNREAYDSDQKTLTVCKECAKTAVDELLEELNHHSDLTGLYTDEDSTHTVIDRIKYFEDVKFEIEQL